MLEKRTQYKRIHIQFRNKSTRTPYQRLRGKPQHAGGVFQDSVMLEVGGSPKAVEDVGSVLYLLTLSDARMCDNGLQVMGREMCYQALPSMLPRFLQTQL